MVGDQMGSHIIPLASGSTSRVPQWVLATGGEVAAQEEIAIRPVGIYRILPPRPGRFRAFANLGTLRAEKGCGRDQRAGAARYANWKTTFQRGCHRIGHRVWRYNSSRARTSEIVLATRASLMLKSAHEFRTVGKTGTKWEARYASAVLNSVVPGSTQFRKSL